MKRYNKLSDSEWRNIFIHMVLNSYYSPTVLIATSKTSGREL